MDYKAAAKRRTQKTMPPTTELGKGELKGIESLIHRQAEAPPAEQGQGYAGPGAAQLHEALSKGASGVDDPNPPQDLVRRILRERITPQIQPDVADLAARYKVI